MQGTTLAEILGDPEDSCPTCGQKLPEPKAPPAPVDDPDQLELFPTKEKV